MDENAERLVLDLLASHNILTLATIREDGWPQATTVGYVNEGLEIFVVTFPEAQKVDNIRHDPRVSLTVDHDESDWHNLQALSMAATAELVSDPVVVERVSRLMREKFPQIEEMPEPEPAGMTVLRLTPKVISILDYEKGFGHTELFEL